MSNSDDIVGRIAQMIEREAKANRELLKEIYRENHILLNKFHDSLEVHQHRWEGFEKESLVLRREFNEIMRNLFKPRGN